MTSTDHSYQNAYPLRCEWADEGLRALASASDALIIVDVFSFTTSVDIATSRGAVVHPFRWRDDRAAAFARSVDAELAGSREGGPSLRPSSLTELEAGQRLVIPSPNGSTLSTLAGDVPLFAGCLRNARAVAQAAQALGSRITVIAAGERWAGTDTLRPAIEDLCGAGAILTHLSGECSPEAEIAMATFRHMEPDLFDALRACHSGREKEERGDLSDVELAAELNASDAAPLLIDGAYRAV